MRHGLIRWDEAELSTAEVTDRQDRLRAALGDAGLDGLIIYTNHVRSGALTWATGFTPYWSDALWYLPRAGAPLFATALSKRVGNWIAATNPTSEIAHSPMPGALIGARLAADGVRRVGVVEFDRMPRALVEQIAEESAAELCDASAVFREVRSVAGAAETSLASRADDLARTAFGAAPSQAETVGDVAGALELSARRGGAEEVYVATAPDLASDTRFARRKGGTSLGERYAARLSLARHGVWIRRIETLAQDDPALASACDWADALCAGLVPEPGLGAAIDESALPSGVSLVHWRFESPVATRPLQSLAETGGDLREAVAYGVLTLRLTTSQGPAVFARPVLRQGTS